MRSESSARSLRHIKTTVFTVVLVLPCISEPAVRSGIGLCQQPFDSKSGLKKRLSSQSFWYSRVSASLSSVREAWTMISSFDSMSVYKKHNEETLCFGTPVHQRACRAYGNRDDDRRPSIPSRDNKSRHKSVCFLVLPTGIEPITNP